MPKSVFDIKLGPVSLFKMKHKGLVVTHLPFKYYVLFIIVGLVVLFVVPPLIAEVITFTSAPKEVSCPSDFKNALLNLIENSAQNKTNWNIPTLGRYATLYVKVPYEFHGFKKPFYETPFFFSCRFGENIGENKNYLYCKSNSISFSKEITNVDENGNIVSKTTIMAFPSTLILNENLTVVNFEIKCTQS